jgi:hypothetical protein
VCSTSRTASGHDARQPADDVDALAVAVIVEDHLAAGHEQRVAGP